MWKLVKKEISHWGPMEFLLACIMAVVAVGLFLVVIRDMMHIVGA
jgi:hypothetical protein